MGLQVDQPLFMILLIPVFAVLYLFWKNNRMTSLEKYTIIGLRFFTFTFLILALSVPQILYPIKGISTVFIVDRSESVKNQESAMFGAVEQAVSEMKPEDRYGIISVSESAQIGQSLSGSEKALATESVIEDRSYTNLAEGLQLGSSLLNNEGKRRLVLLSDGNENVGDVKQQVKLLKKQGIQVDVLPFYPSVEKDVSIEEFHAPANTYLGEQTKLSINLLSTTDTTSRLRITKNNETVIDEEIGIKEGRNSYSFTHSIESPGFHTFKAEIFSEGDGIPQNNLSFAISNAKGTPTILLVEGTEGEGENLNGALEASGLVVSKTNPKLLPTSLAGYLEYQSIIFSNVSATDISGEQMDMIESAVRDFGVGFVMTGGNKSFGLGGYFKTPIEKLLPVEMDLKGKKELPSLGMIIVMDRSGSMSGYKLDLAKEAAARSIELLREKDTLGFIAFDDRPWEIIETGPLTNKEEAADKIRSITEGGGTEIFTPLQQAYAELEPLKLQRKHIILLTDGQSATNGDYLQVISQGLEHNVTLSTVAIGSDADQSLLEQLATEGTGRFYDVQDASTIPSILSRETVLTTRTYIEDDPFYPTYIEGSNFYQVLKDGIPEMNAYIATEPKGRAETILVSEKEDPILSRWKYGLGHTVAWTSDVRGEWSGNWPSWEKWPMIWSEIVTWSLPTYQNDLYDVTQSIDGKNVTLEISSVSHHDMLPLEATVTNDKGQKIDAKVRTKAPGKYEITFIGETGSYFLQLAKRDGEAVTGAFKSGIVVPYSKEFEIQNKNNMLLKEVAELGGGKMLVSPEEAFREIETNSYRKQSVFSQLLLFAFLLFFLEIAIRRFGLTTVVERIKLDRSEKTGKREETKKNIEQTYTRLKKASSTKTKAVTAKNDVKSEPILKKSNNQPTQVADKTISKAPEEKDSTNSSDRLQRLLDAKKRRER